MSKEFQPRQLRPDEQIRTDFIGSLTAVPQAEHLTDRDLTASIEALAEVRSDVDQLIAGYYDAAATRGIEVNRESETSEPVANELEQRLTAVLETVPHPDTLRNEQLSEVMESLAGISYDIDQKMRPLHDAAVLRGIEPVEG